MIGCEPTWASSGALALYAAAKVPSINCVNTKAGFTNPWSFGLAGGGFGLLRGLAHYACGQASIKTVVLMLPDIPVYHVTGPIGAAPVLQQCGKTTKYVYVPFTAVDTTPYAVQAAQDKPDFVISFVGVGPTAVTLVQELEQNGIPASHVALAEGNMTGRVLDQAHGSLNGVYGAFEWDNWTDTKNPEIAAYNQATAAQGVDGRDGSVQTTYAYVMLLYNVAKKIGFGNFNGATFAEFMNSPQNNGFPIPLSTTMAVPGPAGFPQQRNVQVLIAQAQSSSKFRLVAWVPGFTGGPAAP